MGRCVETGSVKPIATIYYAGDSTVQFNCMDSYPQTGLGQILPRFLKEEYPVKNHGKNGRSTKSFIDEGRLAAIYDQISEGDFLFIQFGHNDEKEEDPARYTRPDVEYKENLKKIINVANNKKAHPLLITPIERCHFENGKLYEGMHGPYVKAMLEVAKETDTPVIDLYAMTRSVISELGEEKSQNLYMPDGTHMTQEGAVKYGYCLADGLKSIGGIYKDILIDEIKD